MNYYRITFRKDLPVPGKPLAKAHDWYALICRAKNYDEARAHGRHVASVEGLSYCCAFRLPRAEGLLRIETEGALHREA